MSVFTDLVESMGGDARSAKLSMLRENADRVSEARDPFSTSKSVDDLPNVFEDVHIRAVQEVPGSSYISLSPVYDDGNASIDTEQLPSLGDYWPDIPLQIKENLMDQILEDRPDLFEGVDHFDFNGDSGKWEVNADREPTVADVKADILRRLEIQNADLKEFEGGSTQYAG